MPISPEVSVTEWLDTDDGDNGAPIPFRRYHPEDRCPLGVDHAVAEVKKDLGALSVGQEKGFAEIQSSVQKLSDTLLDPDKGLYLRVKEIEGSRAAVTKWLWVVVTALTGAAVVGLMKLLF
jgi:hypothetical protein